MSVICIHCDGWGCTHCRNDRLAAAGGEQGLTAIELEVEQLRHELAAEKQRSADLARQLEAAVRELAMAKGGVA